MSAGTDAVRRYVSLLRGINVGGHNKVKMRELEEAYREIGFEQVRSYIQSGNLVFGANPEDVTPELEQKIEEQIKARFSLSVSVMVVEAESFKTAVAGSPFADHELEKSVLVFVDGEAATGWVKAATGMAVEGERCVVTGDNVVYLFCPHGLGRSKLANAFLASPPKGAKATMRNWRTVNKILEMLD